MAKLTKADKAILENIVTATRGEAGCTTATPASVKKLVDAGMVELGGPVDGNDGQNYVRATDLGLAEYPVIGNDAPVSENAIVSDTAANGISENEGNMSETQTVETGAAKVKRQHVMVDPSTISVGSGLPPAGKRGGGAGRKSIYPFASLAAPMRDAAGNIVSMSYFFVPAQEGRDAPARSLNATVSGHNKKAKETVDPATGLVPQFKVYEDAENGVTGAKVYRIQ